LPLDNEKASSFLQLLNQNLEEIRSISAVYQDQLIQARQAGNPDNPNFFQPGDFVLYEYHKNQDKVNGMWHGPYEVIKHTNNDVLCRHLVQDNVTTLHVSTLKLFIGTKLEAFEAAKRDFDQYTVLSITAYRGDPLKRTSCQFEVTFENFVTQWENWSEELSQTTQFEDFCHSRHELTPLLYTQSIATARIRELNLTDISEWIDLLDTVYVDLRSYGSDWYTQLSLPDGDHVTYVVPYQYVRWYHRNRRHKVIVTCSLFEEEHTLTGSWVYFWGRHKVLNPSMVEITPSFCVKYPAVLPAESKQRLLKLHKHATLSSSK
jgi:hypothetical protein